MFESAIIIVGLIYAGLITFIATRGEFKKK